MSARQRIESPPSERVIANDIGGLKIQARGLSRSMAAIYVGVSATKFDEMVKDGRMPVAKRVDGRRVWDKRRLDLAFEALPDEGAGTGDSWADV
jgi:hypothetical protein